MFHVHSANFDINLILDFFFEHASRIVPCAVPGACAMQQAHKHTQHTHGEVKTVNKYRIYIRFCRQFSFLYFHIFQHFFRIPIKIKAHKSSWTHDGRSLQIIIFIFSSSSSAAALLAGGSQPYLLLYIILFVPRKRYETEALQGYQHSLCTYTTTSNTTIHVGHFEAHRARYNTTRYICIYHLYHPMKSSFFSLV